MSTIAAVYKMIVYNDGAVDLQLMPMDYLFDELPNNTIQIIPSNISQRAYQIIRVLQEIRSRIVDPTLNDDNLFTMKQIVTDATRKVALELQITEQSVSDKFTRQLGISKNNFVELLVDFFKSAYDAENFYDSSLYKTIKDALSSQGYDLEYVKTSFINTIL